MKWIYNRSIISDLQVIACPIIQKLQKCLVNSDMINHLISIFLSRDIDFKYCGRYLRVMSSPG